MEDLFSPLHLLIVLVIALVIFGPKRLPELGQGLGKSIREFRNAASGLTGPAAGGSDQGTNGGPAGSSTHFANGQGTPPGGTMGGFESGTSGQGAGQFPGADQETRN